MSANLVLHAGMTGKEMAGILDQFIWPDSIDSDVCYETLRFAQGVLFALSRGDIVCRQVFHSAGEAILKNNDESKIS